MLDIKLIRERPDFVKAELAKTGFRPAEVERVIVADARRRKQQFELDELRAHRSRESKALGKLAPADRESGRAEMRALGDRIGEGERALALSETECEYLMLAIPNIPRPHVPVGAGEAENRVARSEGTLPTFSSFKPAPHWEIGEKLGIIDFERGVKLSGTRFHFLVGAGARLERAMIAWMLDVKTLEQGYLELAPPLMVNTATVIGSAHLPKFADTMYRDAEEDFYFIPTAEVPLTNFYAREILDGDRLPINLTAYTPCFRREKMSAGRDVRGIKRGHQFDKVEMVKLVRPETSDAELTRLVEDASAICKRLEIPYRVIEICSGDLGFTAASKFDVEMWAPGVGEWLEVSSCSNCTDFQARRAQIRFRDKGGKPEFVHTLNGSGLGMPRTLIAVLENYQNEDGSVTVPSVLRPYMGGLERIGKL
jgi:seryl-tRNA synthetase